MTLLRQPFAFFLICNLIFPAAMAAHFGDPGFGGRPSGGGILLPPVVAPEEGAEQDMRPFISMAGMKIYGLDVNTFKGGSFYIEVPLKSGTHLMPKDDPKHDRAKLKVAKNTMLRLRARLGQNKNGKSVITRVNSTFRPSVRILNPISAFDPSKSWVVGSIGDSFQDSIADMVVDGVNVDSQGVISVSGIVDKGIFGEDPLSEHIGPDKFPKLELRLEDKLPQKFIARPPEQEDDSGDADDSEVPKEDQAQKSKFDMADFLKRFGKITGVAKYKFDAGTEAAVIGVNSDFIRIETQEGPIRLHLEGRALLKKNGNLMVRTNNKKSTIKTPLIETNLNLKAELNSLAENDGVDSNVTFDIVNQGIFGQINLDLDNEGAFFIPITLSEGMSSLDATTKLSFVDGVSTGVEGKAKIELDGHVADRRQEASLSSIKFGFGKGDFNGKLDLGLTYESDIVKLIGNNITANIKATDPHYEDGDLRVATKNEVELGIVVDEAAYSDTDEMPNILGRLNLSLKHPKKLRELYPDLEDFEQNIQVRLNKKETAVITLQDENDFSTLLQEFVDIDGKQKKVLDFKADDGSKFASIDSQEFKKYISKISSGASAFSSNNKIKYFFDNPKANLAKTDLVNSAKKQIVLQTHSLDGLYSNKALFEAVVKARLAGKEVYVVADAMVGEFDPQALVKLTSTGAKVGLINFEKRKVIESIAALLKENNIDLDLEPLRDTRVLTEGLNALGILLTNVYHPHSELEPVLKSKLAAQMRRLLPREHSKILNKDGSMNMLGVADAIESLVKLSLQSFEEYLVVDGEKVLLGHADSAVLAHGAAAADAHRVVSERYKDLTGEVIYAAQNQTQKLNLEAHKTQVQLITHRPQVDDEHNIVNFYIAALRSLAAGQEAYLSLPNFLPAGVLKNLKLAMLDATRRGAKITLLTNSKESYSGRADINKAAVFTYRELLEAGVDIYEMLPGRELTQSLFAFGKTVSGTTTWSATNRASAMQAHGLFVSYDAKLASDMGDHINLYLDPERTQKITQENTSAQSWRDEFESTWHNWFADWL